MLTLDAARALVEAGYMPLSAYLDMVAEETFAPGPEANDDSPEISVPVAAA